jgi:hypothetical protein
VESAEEDLNYKKNFIKKVGSDWNAFIYSYLMPCCLTNIAGEFHEKADEDKTIDEDNKEEHCQKAKKSAK